MFGRHDLASPSRIKALKIASCAILASLLVVCAQVVLLKAGSVRAQGTLDVCSGCTYEGIQEAIDAADPGDTIRVAQGVYTENLVITKSLTLLGGFESAGWTRDIEVYETTIGGNRSGSVISVTNGCSTTIDGFTVTGGDAPKGAGVYVDRASVSITRNRIEDNVAWFIERPITITEPLRAGDTEVNGVCDPDVVSVVDVWDWTTGSNIGYAYPEADGSFSADLWEGLVEGHIIWACDRYGCDKALVEASLGEGTVAGDMSETALGADTVTPPGMWFNSQRDTNGESVRPALAGGAASTLGQGDELLMGGGGIYLVDSTAVITGNAIVNNTARDFGGGIYAEHSSLVVLANDVISNSAGAIVPYSWAGGFGGGIAVSGESQFTISSNYVGENVILRGGGGIFITDSMGSLVGNEIAANASHHNSAWACGGGVYVENCSPVIEGNQIISNSLGTESFPTYECAYGGGLYLLGSSSLVTDNDILGNVVVVHWSGWTTGQGGGIHVQQDPNYGYPDSCVDSWQKDSGRESWPIVANNRLVGNRIERPVGGQWDTAGAGTGGGISVWGSSVSLLDNRVTDNWTGADGGGVSVLSWRYPLGECTVVISGNQVADNRSSNSEWFGAGGLLVGATTGTVQRNLIVGNEGSLAGGLYVAGDWMAVEGNEIRGNRSAGVGGLAAGDDSAETIISENLVLENEGVVGGMDLMEGSFVVSHNRVLSNTGQFAGGVGTEFSGTHVLMDANEVMGNRSRGLGGGMGISPGTVFTLTNNTIADNSAEEMGGGIYISDSQGSLVNNTIAQNEEGAGEGVYLDGTAEATILNNIIVSHTYGIYNAGSGTPDVTYNDVWGNSVGDYYGVAPGTGNISSDPRFVDPDSWDYHLWLYSPAVDAGHPDEDLAPAWDIDGDPRPLGSGVDMGADEVPFEVWVWKTDQPDPVLPGGLLTYTVRLFNVSWESYGGLVVTDRVPVNTSMYWASADGEETGGVVSWAIGSLGVGEMVSRTMVVEVDEGLTDGSVIDNAAYGASSEDLTRPVMGVPVQTRVGVPLLEISKVGEPDPVRAGTALTYTLEVKNNGGMRATGLEIWDMVPENTQFSWASDGGEETGGVVSWTVAELGSGNSIERTTVVTVQEEVADGTWIENVEYGVQCDEVPEPVMGPLVSTTVGVPVLAIEKSDEPDPVMPGEELTYTIVVTNDGGWETAGVVITDRIPVGTVFHSASDGGGVMGDVVSWTLPFLEAGGSVQRTMVVTVSDGLSDGTVIENDDYGVKSEDTEAVMGASVSTLVGLPVLSIGKEVEPELAFPGGEVEYMIIVNNEGHHAATWLVITDRVPVDAGFAWVLDGGELAGDEVRWTGLTVGPGESVTVHWGATVTDDLLVPEVVNESYGVLCLEVPEAVTGEAVHTPILRHKVLLPLGMKKRLQ
jgi:uncharacterized repeat protein (TIGR01451 family)